jgi:hypothetical protein
MALVLVLEFFLDNDFLIFIEFFSSNYSDTAKFTKLSSNLLLTHILCIFDFYSN